MSSEETQDSDSEGRKKRPRGILSPTDREFLLGTGDFSRQSAYNRRREIIDRTTNAILDLRILATHLEDRMIEGIASNLSQHQNEQQDNPGTSRKFNRSLVAAIVLFYRLYDGSVRLFEALFEHGMRAAIEDDRGGEWSVNVDITTEKVEQFDIEHVIQRLKAGDVSGLTKYEKRVVMDILVQNDLLDLDALCEDDDDE